MLKLRQVVTLVSPSPPDCSYPSIHSKTAEKSQFVTGESAVVLYIEPALVLSTQA